MSDPRSGNNDPSMDDILASIRKIISDDEARAQVKGQQAPDASEPKRSNEVLLLTDLIEDGQQPTVTGGAPQPVPPGAPPRIDPARAAEMPQPSVEAPADSTLLGAAMAGAASSAFARLNQAVQDSVPAPSAADPGPTVGGSSRTVEDLVKEMLRPMLKEWLDRNLPAMVERYVEREIARLTRR